MMLISLQLKTAGKVCHLTRGVTFIQSETVPEQW